MSRPGGERSIERRVRRVATRLGLHLMIADKPDAQVRAHGGYMLREPITMRIIFGNKDYPYCADIEEIEAFLEARQETA
ncbi:MAG: hypothetical protein P4L66_14710 [Acetobacteraceae bacterium]|nr:hypothetical protein [Acetobacteraceae bacterium]